MMIVNLTPHPLVFADGRTIESSGIARCEQKDTEIGSIDGVPIVTTTFGAVVGLPDPVQGTVYVVSSITAQAVRNRADVFVPARPIRDDQGRIVGCAALGRVGTATMKQYLVTCPSRDNGAEICYVSAPDAASALAMAAENGKPSYGWDGAVAVELLADLGETRPDAVFADLCRMGWQPNLSPALKLRRA